MEIQTFFLAQEIRQKGDWEDIRSLDFGTLTCAPWMEFPTRFSLPFYLRLHRGTRTGNAPFRLRFDLHDADGRPVGLPNGFVVDSVFPAGKWNFRINGHILFEFPGLGYYSLDIALDNDPEGRVFRYAIDLSPPE